MRMDWMEDANARRNKKYMRDDEMFGRSFVRLRRGGMWDMVCRRFENASKGLGQRIGATALTGKCNVSC